VCVCVSECARVEGSSTSGWGEAQGAGGGMRTNSLLVLSLVLSGAAKKGVLNKH
jgi:hypothetical protein